MTEDSDTTTTTTEARATSEEPQAGARIRTRSRARRDPDDSGGRDRRDRKARRARDGDDNRDTATDAAAGTAAPAGDAEPAPDGGRRRRRRGSRGRRGRGHGKQARQRPGPRSHDDDSSRRDEDRDATEAAPSSPDDTTAATVPARGGTRLAAKRGRHGSHNGHDGGTGPRTGGVPEDVRRAILEGPPRTMLVTSRADRTQIAVLEDRTVVEHFVTTHDDVTYVGNIYMARVQNVLPGMEAAFLDIGKGRNGVLYAGEVLYDELDLDEDGDELPHDVPRTEQRIENVLKPGQTVMVQVTKDPMGTKGPRLTMHLSLAGRYMVLAPNTDLFGISRKLTDKERDRLRRIVKEVKPEEHGVIVRTAAEGASDEQLTADLKRLLAKWARVVERAEGAKPLTAVYEEPPLHVKVIRDNFGPGFARCVIDSEELYAQVRDYLEEVAPELLDKVELYDGPDGAGKGKRKSRSKSADAAEADEETPARPLFEAFNVDDQLRQAMGRKVWLPSGGYLVVDATEAMKVIDVNTGKFTGDADANLEEIVLKTNLEAAEEIVRQLRLRDIGGIIVIDFIDMLLEANQQQVVRRLKRELLRDRTKTRVSEVSRLGLVQMTRKNVSKGLVESFSHTCEHCDGLGYISELDS